MSRKNTELSYKQRVVIYFYALEDEKKIKNKTRKMYFFQVLEKKLNVIHICDMLVRYCIRYVLLHIILANLASWHLYMNPHCHYIMMLKNFNAEIDGINIFFEGMRFLIIIFHFSYTVAD